MNSLVVLTDKYPYASGENFIEAERPFWDIFDRIYICPVLLRKSDVLRSGFNCTPKESVVETFDEDLNPITIVSGLGGGLPFKELMKEMAFLRHSPLKMKTEVGAYILTNLRTKRILKKLIELIENPEEERLLIYSYWMYEPALTAISVKKYFPRSRFITRAHGYDLYNERQPKGFFPFRSLLFNVVDAIYPISNNGYEYLHSCYNGEYDGKISVERLGTIKLFNTPSNDESENNRVTIVSCSNMVPLKRIDRIIEALKQFSGNCSWYHFGDGELMSDLNEKAAALPNNIQACFAGRVPNQDIQKFYSEHKIDAFVNVSESEGVPVTIMEAQSYGIPVIATDVGGTAELVHNNENGILLSRDFETQDLLNAFDSVLNSASLFRHNAENTWRQYSDAKEIYKRFFQEEFTRINR